MISQTNDPLTLKQHQKDFTNVTTENHSQHTNDSSFSEKSTQKDVLNQTSMEEDPSNEEECQKMEESIQKDEKKSRQKYYKKCIEWLCRRYKRFKVKIETLYLSMTYLIKFMGLNEQITHSYDVLSAICLLIAAKLNQIHYPSIKSLLSAIDTPTTKRDIFHAQQQLLQDFNFDIASTTNSFSLINEYFSDDNEEKRKNAQKLLFLCINNLETIEFGEIYLGYSIVYLLKPEAMKERVEVNRERMKRIAFIVYGMYKEKKSQLAKRQHSE